MTYMFYDVLRFLLKAYETSVSAFVSQQLVRQVLKTGKIVPSLSKDGKRSFTCVLTFILNNK